VAPTASTGQSRITERAQTAGGAWQSAGMKGLHMAGMNDLLLLGQGFRKGSTLSVMARNGWWRIFLYETTGATAR